MSNHELNAERERLLREMVESLDAVIDEMLAAIESGDSSTVVKGLPQYAQRAGEITGGLITALTPRSDALRLPPEPEA
jgi:hypothetical protein